MATRLVHRGPDSDGYLVDGPVALGVRRLSIIDLATGDQPIFNEDRSVAVIQNGEIYNFPALRAELEQAGHVFRSRSDTEVIAHLYEQDGERFVERLLGMFAIAVYDLRRQRLVLARDRLGKKPLYYADLGTRLVFGSELKALLSLPSFPRTIDEPALLEFFTYRAVPGPRTIFRAARKLQPGHLLVVDADGPHEPRCYWRLSFADPFDDRPEILAERLRELLFESVRDRLVSDVPLGAFLSGGIDSSAVVAAMVSVSSGEVRTFSVGFDDPRHDERQAAAQTARALGTTHTESIVRLDPNAALDVLPWHFDEPFSDASAVTTYAVSRMAREHVTVALSGDGGDENFAGYTHHLYPMVAGRVRRALPGVPRPLWGALSAVYPRAPWVPRPLRGKTMLSYLSKDPVRGYARLVRATDPGLLLRLLDGDVRGQLHGYDPTAVLHDRYARTDAPDSLGRMLQLDLASYLVDDILTKVDRASMAASLEVRCPLLDHRLVEFAARIPSAYKLQAGVGKWIFRRALEGLVPAQILTRPKHGFDVPLGAWTLGPLRPAIEAAIAGLSPGLFDRTSLSSAWQEHQVGKRDHTELFWALLMLDRWRTVHDVPLP
jgi:asparagine synthase (glutamine-hydrolysing)